MTDITIRQRDWSETLADVAGVDLVLTDPPYAISRKTGYKSGKLKKFHVNTEFGDWDNQPIDVVRLAEQCYCCLRQGGTAVIWCDLWKLTHLADAMRATCFKKLRFIEWVKTNPVPLNAGRSYLSNAREVAVVGVRGGGGKFHANYDNGIYSYPIPSGPKRVHPTQKPLCLFEEIIEKHTDVNDLVVDPFLGSGTTAEAAMNLGRRFIGGDADARWVNHAERRVTYVD